VKGGGGAGQLVDLAVLQALMGHDHVDSAAAYIHLSPAHVRPVAQVPPRSVPERWSWDRHLEGVNENYVDRSSLSLINPSVVKDDAAAGGPRSNPRAGVETYGRAVGVVGGHQGEAIGGNRQVGREIARGGAESGDHLVGGMVVGAWAPGRRRVGGRVRAKTSAGAAEDPLQGWVSRAAPKAAVTVTATFHGARECVLSSFPRLPCNTANRPVSAHPDFIVVSSRAGVVRRVVAPP
jgi:hypothetical protein